MSPLPMAVYILAVVLPSILKAGAAQFCMLVHYRMFQPLSLNLKPNSLMLLNLHNCPPPLA